MFHDNRAKTIEVFSPQYPYTIIVEYTQDFHQFIHIPGWYPQVTYMVGVESSTYTITSNEQNPIKYKSFQVEEPQKTTIAPGKIKLKWSASNLVPIQREPYSPEYPEIFSTLLVVPECFEYKNSRGCFTSWENYGEWVSGMLQGRSDLDDKKKNEILDLTKNLKTDTEKIQAIYEYMQNHTRYVSVQLGIGGFQPFPARYVAETGWGDCKALVNYTKALLGVVNIPSHYCEIGVQDTKILFPDFPSVDQTNHIVLAIPQEKDTLWLECTSQHIPFGYVTSSIQNQMVLWVDEDKKSGKIVNTPSPDASYNVRLRKIELTLENDGNATGRMNTEVRGAEIERLFPEIWQSDKEQKKAIANKYPIAGFRLLSLAYDIRKGSETTASETIEMNIQSLASVTGNRLFVPSNVFEDLKGIPAKSKSRKSDVVIDYAYCHIDSVTLKIPTGFKPETLPQEKQVINKFGHFKAKFIVDGQNICYVKELKINRYRGSASEFNVFIDFLNDAARCDRQILVLAK
jgi:hypothetical protein